MIVRLSYGAAECLTLDCPATVELTDWSKPDAPPPIDPALAARTALAEPLEHPPLMVAVVRGDRIVVSVEPGLPCADELLAGILGTLVDAGHSPGDLTVLWSAIGAQDAPPDAGIDAACRREIQFVRHDPDDASQLAYLAASRDANPVYLNRVLCDADYVLPVGLLRTRRSVGYLGLFGGLFPAFSGRETQQRLRPALGRSRVANQKKLRALVDEAAWLLGVQFTVQVVPGPNDTVLDVLAGTAPAVQKAGKQRCEAVWQNALPQAASLVVAAIDGGSAQQTWDNVARTLRTAARAVADQGAIALVTQLATRPGPALRRFGQWTDDQPLPSLRRIEAEPDAVAAQLLLTARQRARVYFVSKLSRAVVESLGMIHVDEAADVARLITHHTSCLVLGSAQHATISLETQEPAS